MEQKDQEFKELDKLERDLFIHLQAAVKTSHEKEKVHTNSAKYWSIVGTLAGNKKIIFFWALAMPKRNIFLEFQFSSKKIFQNIHRFSSFRCIVGNLRYRI